MKRIRKGFVGIIVLLLVVSGSFYAFSSYVKYLNNDAMETRLKETAENNADSVTTLINNDSKVLEGIANLMVMQKDYANDAVMSDALKNSLTLTNFDHIVYYTTDGFLYSDAGEGVYHMDDTVAEVMRTGDITIACMGEDKSIGINVAMYKDGEIIGVLRGVYKAQTIGEVLNMSTFDGKGYFSVVNKNGDFLYRTNKLQNLYREDNVFVVLEGAKFDKGSSLKQIKMAMLKDESFLVSYTLEGMERFAYYTPTDIQGWYIFSAVPSSYMLDQTRHVEFVALFLMGTMAILFCCLLAIIRNQNHKSKEQLQNEFESVERILGNVPLPVFVIGVDHSIRQVNDAACEVFHKSREEMIHLPCQNLHTSICNTKDCAIKRLLEGQKTSIMETNNRVYQVVSTILSDEYDNVIGYIEVMQDITKLMKIQHDLEETTLELKAVSENLMGGILITNLDEGFSVIQCNQGYLKMVGKSEEDVIGKPATQWLLKEEANNVESTILQQLKEDGEVYLEHSLKNENDEKIWISVFGRASKFQNHPVGIWLLININDRKEAEQKMLINEQRYRIALENTEDIIIDYDLEKDLMLHNDRVMDVYGVPTIVERPLENIVNAGIIAEDSVEEFSKMFDELRKGVEKASYEVLTRPKQGDDVWCRITFTTIFDTEGKPVRAIGILHDINDEKKAILQYKREAQYRKVTTEDAALYYEADLTMKKFLGGHEELLKACAVNDTNDFDIVVDLMVQHLVYSEDRQLVRNHISWDSLSRAYQAGETKIDFEYQRILGSEQSLGWVQCTIYMTEDEESHHVLVIGYIKDIDEAKKLELYLKKQAEQDLLTGLYNKITTENLIKESLMKKEDGLCALMIIDLDDFKQINDSLGHSFGDAVLSEVSQHLKELFRRDDVVGRIGGDEFIVYLRKLVNQQEAINRAISICKMFHSSYTGANNYKVSGSLGIAFSPNDGRDFETLYKKADIALYSAKNGGKDMYCAFHEDLPQIGAQAQPRKIDVNYGKQLSENIGGFVLRILYEAQKPEKVFNAILELLSKQYGYSRGYIFEHNVESDDWVNTYEWCEVGTPTQKKNLQKVHFSKRGYYESFFDDNGVFMMNDAQNMDAEVYKAIKNVNIQSFVQFALKEDGVMKAFMGFDDYKHHHVPNGEEMETLHNVVMLIDTFAFRTKNK